MGYTGVAGRIAQRAERIANGLVGCVGLSVESVSPFAGLPGFAKRMANREK